MKHITKYKSKHFIFKLKQSHLYNWRKISKFKKISKRNKRDISNLNNEELVSLSIQWDRIDKVFKKKNWKKIIEESK